MRQRSTGDEFERALDLAETLLASYDRGRMRMRVLAAVAVVLTALIAPAIGWAANLAFSKFRAATLLATAVIIVAVGLGVAAWTSAALAQSLRLTTERDERAMLEMADLLRELLPDIADHEQWSPARYQLTRTRVARFPIGDRRATR